MKKPVAKVEFRKFEVSYSNGWNKGFSFSVDSNRIFFASLKTDSLKYGILPDSVFELIKPIIFKLQNTYPTRLDSSHCSDCPVISIQVVSKNDTIRITQSDNIDNLFLKIIKPLYNFVDLKHSSFKYTPDFGTRAFVFPKPPVVIDTVHFTPPEHR